jgi:hypothetical protein
LICFNIIIPVTNPNYYLKKLREYIFPQTPVLGFILLKRVSFFFQHLVWILGLKPSTGGSLKAGRTTADSNAVITTAVMADLPVLSAMLSRLFESSQYLDDVALHHLIDALCKLSHEAMELAYSNRVRKLSLCVWN